eukprot:TRINITY_DN5194_c0_g1_i1.p1 TRINITY_DN5194_c0_g1~~TRINITY_DN5194_c0_g1_i1.p1  ORF type:complete len:525 (+),score=167.63 TRINITY_DN5194_c0_g1_i1:88-1662(+)
MATASWKPFRGYERDDKGNETFECMILNADDKREIIFRAHEHVPADGYSRWDWGCSTFKKRDCTVRMVVEDGEDLGEEEWTGAEPHHFFGEEGTEGEEPKGGKEGKEWKREIYRAADDFECEYGDGGYSNVCRPIWVCDELKVSQVAIKNLKKGIATLSATRHDFQKNKVVEDIVDPDLMPHPSKFTSYKEMKLENLNKVKDTERSARRLIAEWRHLESDSSLDERVRYQWIPSVVSFDAKGKARFLSEIHNLTKKKKTLGIYAALEGVLSSMSPMFQKLGVLEEDEESQLQIVVKVQRYNLEPSMTYSGRWHTEGMSENVVAAGVYYLEVDPGISGGNLKFRPSEGPQPNYRIDTDVEVRVKEGAAIVFSNILPHRFRTITNSSNTPQTRTFINFFVIDPSKPLHPTTAEFASSELLLQTLIQMGKNSTNQTIPIPMYKEILCHIPGIWTSLLDAQRLRQRGRDAMSQVKNGWGWINFGNCGTINYCISEKITEAELYGWESYQGNHLNHTDSDGVLGKSSQM